MSFDDFSDTDTALRDSLGRWLADHIDLTRHARADAPPSPPVWRSLARDLGLTGAGLPESAGGLGGGLRAHLVVLRTLGGSLCAEPYLSTALVCGGALQRAGTPLANHLLAAIAAGDAVVAWAHAEPGARNAARPAACTLHQEGAGWRLDGRKSAVTTAPWATHWLVTACIAGSGASALVLLDAGSPGLTRRDLRALDGGWASEVLLDHVALPEVAVLQTGQAADDNIASALDAGALGVCAEALGVLEKMMADTLAHVRERRQFGVPIAGFQALQHRLADMHIAIAQAEALTWAVADAPDDAGEAGSTTNDTTAQSRALAVSAAKVTVGAACRTVGQGAVQLHGAMGVTEELPVGRFFRRATQIELMFGSSGQHLRRIDRLQAPVRGLAGAASA